MTKDKENPKTKTPLSQSGLKELLDTLLREANEQRQWFNKDSKKQPETTQAKYYAQGSRDAYAYMMGAINEIKERV